MVFDVQKIRKDFPVLEQKVYDYPLAYFDNGATTQKPAKVIETIRRYYEEENSSIHRGSREEERTKRSARRNKAELAKGDQKIFKRASKQW